jgi:predicted permease
MRGGWAGLLSPETSRRVSTLVALVAMPSLSLVALGSKLSLPDMAELWPLVVWGLGFVAVGAAVGVAVALLARVPRAQRELFVVACAFPNVGTLPMVLLQTMCFSETLSGEPDCFTRATAYIFLPTLTSSLLFWTVGDSVLADAGFVGAARAARGPGGCGTRLARMARRILNPNMICTLGGLLIAITPGVRPLLFGADAPLGFLGALLQLLGQPTNSLSQMLLGASVGRSVAGLPWGRVRAFCRRATSGLGPRARRASYARAPENGDSLPVADKSLGGSVPASTAIGEDDEDSLLPLDTASGSGGAAAAAPPPVTASSLDSDVELAGTVAMAAAAPATTEPMSPRTIVILSVVRAVVIPLLLFGFAVAVFEPHISGRVPPNQV